MTKTRTGNHGLPDIRKRKRNIDPRPMQNISRLLYLRLEGQSSGTSHAPRFTAFYRYQENKGRLTIPLPHYCEVQSADIDCWGTASRNGTTETMGHGLQQNKIRSTRYQIKSCEGKLLYENAFLQLQELHEFGPWWSGDVAVQGERLKRGAGRDF